MCTKRLRNGNRSTRRGVLTMELILTLPLVIVVILATVEFALLLMAEQAVQAAAAVGARTAAVPSATRSSVVNAVGRALEPWSFARRVEPVRIQINGVPEQQYALSMARTGDSVAVTVRVDAAAVAPDIFGCLGMSIADRKLTGTYVARKE